VYPMTATTATRLTVHGWGQIEEMSNPRNSQIEEKQFMTF